MCVGDGICGRVGLPGNSKLGWADRTNTLNVNSVRLYKKPSCQTPQHHRRSLKIPRAQGLGRALHCRDIHRTIEEASETILPSSLCQRPQIIIIFKVLCKKLRGRMAHNLNENSPCKALLVRVPWLQHHTSPKSDRRYVRYITDTCGSECEHFPFKTRSHCSAGGYNPDCMLLGPGLLCQSRLQHP